VISEVKDEKSREYILNKLPYEIEVKNHETFLERSDITSVHNFAKDTGDF
jgi:rRNA maturation endonuclease Nob1